MKLLRKHAESLGLGLVALCFFANPFPALAVEILTDVESGQIFERVEWIKPGEHVRLTLKSGCPNHWWLFSLRGTRGQTLTLDVVGTNSIHASFPWKGVLPVMTDHLELADPALYNEAAYQKQFAKQLPWRRIETAQYNASSRTMTMRVKFPSDVATIALKYPCPPSYVEARLQQLSGALMTGQVGTYEAGRTAQGRPLRIITVPAIAGQSLLRWKEKPTFLLYGGEHATEHDSSQVIMGALDWLGSNTPEALQFRNAYNVLLIPHLAPDDTANSVFNRITDGFLGSTFGYGRENVLWAKFWTGYIEQGYRLDTVISFHNVGGAESPNLFSPATQVSKTANRRFAEALHQAVLQRVKATGAKAQGSMGGNGSYSSRLFGWLETRFGVVGAVYEVNSQWPAHRLSLSQLRGIGVAALQGCADFSGHRELFTEQRVWQQERLAQRTKHKREILASARINTNAVPEWVTFNNLW